MKWSEKRWLNNDDLRLVGAKGLKALSESVQKPINARKLRRIIVEYLWFMLTALGEIPAPLTKKLEQFAAGTIERDQLDQALIRCQKKCVTLRIFGFPWASASAGQPLFQDIEDVITWVYHCILSAERFFNPQHPFHATDGNDVHAPFVMAFIRDIIGNPFRRVVCEERWRGANVVALAQGIHADRAFDHLPILADALEEAGCTDANILNHCRSEGRHVRGCWVVDLLLGKE